ncbi:MAG: hypothetical protein DRQ88_04865 [Epsilonproteobacteria bacterium]|nr:MAG: hypothetical protein DRQ88_04865 [Campylobacterota bacterium]
MKIFILILLLCSTDVYAKKVSCFVRGKVNKKGKMVIAGATTPALVEMLEKKGFEVKFILPEQNYQLDDVKRFHNELKVLFKEVKKVDSLATLFKKRDFWNKVPFLKTMRKIITQNLAYMRCDNIILPGGSDVAKEFYQFSDSNVGNFETGKINYLEDMGYFISIDFALQKKVPVFGFCRGHQAVNVFFGGTLGKFSKMSKGKRTIKLGGAPSRFSNIFYPKESKNKLLFAHSFYVKRPPKIGKTTAFYYNKRDKINVSSLYELPQYQMYTTQGHPEGVRVSKVLGLFMMRTDFSKKLFNSFLDIKKR